MIKKIITMGLVGVALCFNAGYAGQNEIPPAERRVTPSEKKPDATIGDKKFTYTADMLKNLQDGGKMYFSVSVGIICAAGQYLPEGATQCADCPCGNWCANNVRNSCPPNTYRTAIRATQQSDCVDLTDGYKLVAGKANSEGMCNQEGKEYTAVVFYTGRDGQVKEYEQKGCKFGTPCDIDETKLKEQIAREFGSAVDLGSYILKGLTKGS